MHFRCSRVTLPVRRLSLTHSLTRWPTVGLLTLLEIIPVVSARDAWIQADLNRYQGANKCLLYKAFASRGLGFNAKNDFMDNEDLPPDCPLVRGR